MVYGVMFLILLYFKIARVHAKEEHVSLVLWISHLWVIISAMGLVIYALMHDVGVPSFVGMGVVFAIMVSFMITALQLGIFVDGKPLLGLSRVYRYLSTLAGLIVGLTLMMWWLHFE